MPAFLVTRSDSAIGGEICAALAADGHRVMAASSTGRRPSPAEPYHVLSSTAVDMRSSESVHEAVLHTVELFGGLDGVILQSGVEWFSPVELIPSDLFAEAIDSQVVGALRVLKAVIPHIRRSGRGRVVALSSLGARYGLPIQAGCCSVKSALEAMLESLRFEVEPFGTRVTIVQPGYSIGTSDDPTAPGPSQPVRNLPAHSVYEPLIDIALDSDRMNLGRVDVADAVELVRHVLTVDEPPFRTTLGAYAEMADGLRRGDDQDAVAAFTAMLGIERWLAGADGRGRG